MAWYGKEPTEAELALNREQKAEAIERRQAVEEAEASKDPYRRKVSWNVKGNFGDGIRKRPKI